MRVYENAITKLTIKSVHGRKFEKEFDVPFTRKTLKKALDTLTQGSYVSYVNLQQYPNIFQTFYFNNIRNGNNDSESWEAMDAEHSFEFGIYTIFGYCSNLYDKIYKEMRKYFRKEGQRFNNGNNLIHFDSNFETGEEPITINVSLSVDECTIPGINNKELANLLSDFFKNALNPKIAALIEVDNIYMDENWDGDCVQTAIYIKNPLKTLL